ncbi:integrase core domain-containing protein [Acinetobacter rathckeae]|nr:transposase [Acinetobacter rathckeae]MBF7695740.1 transposase [Acinetobacter rathckeae]
MTIFQEIDDVQNCTTAWQYFYNYERPHMSVDSRPTNFKQ